MALVLGVCAMDCKARSKPMRNILDRLLATKDFEIVIFGDKVILDEAVENWPEADFLISFFSKDFPLDKAIEYVKLRKPFCVNDLILQKLLWDRRLVDDVCLHVGIPTPNRLFANRNVEGKNTSLPDFVNEDLQKRIYQQTGLQLNKLKWEASEIIQVDDDTISIDGILMSKPFVEKPVDGEDHNIYIYYPKSMGGGVRRLFRKVGNKSSEFCPDIVQIRSEGSYIYEEFMTVDNMEDVKVYTVGVNFSHAETRKSPVVDGLVQRDRHGKEIRYVTELTPEEKEIARKVSRSFGQAICGFDLLRYKGKTYVIDVNGWSFVKGNEEYYNRCAKNLRQMCLRSARARRLNMFSRRSFTEQWKLKSYISIVRHADRTPKQKQKFLFTSRVFSDLLQEKNEEVMLCGVEQLSQIMEAVEKAKVEQIEKIEDLNNLGLILEKKSKLLGTKVQVKPHKKVDSSLPQPVQVIVKWGGEFTHAGYHQSKDAGENLRKDLMIMNKEVLENVKICTAFERRVFATAEVFTKYLLDIPSVPKDLLVVSRQILDDMNASKEECEQVKKKLRQILNTPNPMISFPEQTNEYPEVSSGPMALVDDVIRNMQFIRNAMNENSSKFDEYDATTKWCCSETGKLFKERWERLFKEFCDVERSKFDSSRVSELYDSLKYDTIHNREFIDAVFISKSNVEEGKDRLRELCKCAKTLFDYVAPKEYGIEDAERLAVGVQTSEHLIQRLLDDFKSAVKSPTPFSRFYFTKESHVHCLLNVVLLSGIPTRNEMKMVNEELDYLTQITFEIYERDRTVSQKDYSVRIQYTPGAVWANWIDMVVGPDHALSVAPRRCITDFIDLDELYEKIQEAMIGYCTYHS